MTLVTFKELLIGREFNFKINKTNFKIYIYLFFSFYYLFSFSSVLSLFFSSFILISVEKYHSLIGQNESFSVVLLFIVS